MTFGRFFGRYVRLSFDSRSEERSLSSIRRAPRPLSERAVRTGRGKDKRTSDNASRDRRTAQGHQSDGSLEAQRCTRRGAGAEYSRVRGSRYETHPALHPIRAHFGVVDATGHRHTADGVMSKIPNCYPAAKRQDGILQCPDAGEPQGCGRGIEAAELPLQCRDALAETVCPPGRPGERRFGVHPRGAGEVIVDKSPDDGGVTVAG